MNNEELKAYCLSRTGTTAENPFGPEVWVLKVMGKMFAIIPVEVAEGKTATISLKCDPAWSEILRQTYSAVKPGYHLNKQHWNTVTMDDGVPDDEVREMIDHSYELVVKGLKKAEREALGKL